MSAYNDGIERAALYMETALLITEEGRRRMAADIRALKQEGVETALPEGASSPRSTSDSPPSPTPVQGRAWTAEQILRRALTEAAGRFGLALSLGVDWIKKDDHAGMVSMAVGLDEANAALDAAVPSPAERGREEALEEAERILAFVGKYKTVMHVNAEGACKVARALLSLVKSSSRE